MNSYANLDLISLRASATGTDVTVTSQLARGDGRTESYVPTYQEGRQHSSKIFAYQEGNTRALLILHTYRGSRQCCILNLFIRSRTMF